MKQKCRREVNNNLQRLTVRIYVNFGADEINRRSHHKLSSDLLQVIGWFIHDGVFIEKSDVSYVTHPSILRKRRTICSWWRHKLFSCCLLLTPGQLTDKVYEYIFCNKPRRYVLTGFNNRLYLVLLMIFLPYWLNRSVNSNWMR